MSVSIYQCKRFEETGALTVPFWYDASREFVEALSEEIPDEIVRDEKVTYDFAGLKRIWKDHHAAMLDNQKWWIIIGSFLILFALVYTIFSIVHCICLCKRKSKIKEDSSGIMCKRTALNVILFLHVVLAICFLAFMLISSTDAKNNAAALPTYLSTCLGDVQKYAENATNEARIAVDGGFKVLKGDVDAAIKQLIIATEKEIKKNEAERAKPPPTDALKGDLTKAHQRYEPMADALDSLSALSDDLEELENEFKFVDCTKVAGCEKVVNRTEDVLSVLHQFRKAQTSNVPDAAALPADSTVDELYSERRKLRKVYGDFLDKKLQAQRDLQKAAKNQMSSVDKALAKVSGEVSSKADSVVGLPRQIRDYIGENRANYGNRIRYAWAGFVALGLLFSVILVLYIVGLIFGCLGRSPAEDKRNCIRTTGRTFYTIAIIITAVFAIFLAVLATLLMLFGAAIQTFMCGPLQDPFTHPLVGKAGDFAGHPTISEALRRCGDTDATLFTALDLQRDVNAISKSVHDGIDALVFQPPAKSNPPSEIPFLLPAFDEEHRTLVSESLRNVTLTAAALKIDHLPVQALMQDAIDKIEEIRITARDLQSLWNRFAAQYKKVAKELRKTQLENGKLRSQLAKGVNIAKAEARNMMRSLNTKVDKYVNDVNTTLRTRILPCRPVKDVVINSAVAVCSYVVDPFNGTWLALLLCLVTTIIIAFVSTCASRTYYRKKKQRPVRQWIPPPTSILPESSTMAESPPVSTANESPPVDAESDYRPQKVAWTPEWERATVNATQPSRKEILV